LLEAVNVYAAVVSAPMLRSVSRSAARNIGPKFLEPSRGSASRPRIEGDWARWLGDSGEFVGMTGFGASAPAEVLYREFGITADAVAKAALHCLVRSKLAAARS